MSRESLGWWGESWLAWLRALRVGPASEGQYRSALRAEGQVELKPGRLSARVWAGERRQVMTVIQVRPWADRAWRTAVESIAARAEVAQSVLSGSFSSDLAGALEKAELRIFPNEASLGCSCGNRSRNCRHLNFLAVTVAEQLDANPFLWLEVLGRNRTELLAELKGVLADREGRASRGAKVRAALPLDPARFWEGEVDSEAILAAPSNATALRADPEGVTPSALLRSLGPLPWEETLHLLPSRTPVQAEEALRRMVERVGRTAADLLKGEREPEFQSAPLPGKSISPGVLPGKAVNPALRLVPEVEEVVRAREGFCLVEELYEHCPTARALGDAEQALRPLLEACRHLSPDLILVANRYVGRASALLEGAAFRHVVTFEEWLAGQAWADGDWVRALAAAGWERPSLAAEFRRLEPAVGDELWISPREGGVGLRLVRRQERDPWESLHADATVGQVLQMLIGQMQTERLPEREAVTALLAEGVYRDGLHPDPIWLLPMLELGLYQDPADRVITRQPTGWRHGFPRFIYGNWRRDEALREYQARLMKGWAPLRQIEMATACIDWWGSLWRGAQDGPTAADSLGPFLDFLWNVAPREAQGRRIDPQQVPSMMDDWFALLEERYPAVAGLYDGHRKACALREHYADRLATAPPPGAQRGALLAWLAEGFRWIGPVHYLQNGSY